MRHLLVGLSLVLAVAVQPLLNERLGAVVAVPLPLLVAAAAMFVFDGSPLLLWAAAAGLLNDCLSPAPPGIDMLAATSVVFAMRRILDNRPTFGLAMFPLGIAVALFCMQAVSITGRALFHHTPLDTIAMLEASGKSSVGAGLLALGALITLRTLAFLARQRPRWKSA